MKKYHGMSYSFISLHQTATGLIKMTCNDAHTTSYMYMHSCLFHS